MHRLGHMQHAADVCLRQQPPMWIERAAPAQAGVAGA